MPVNDWLRGPLREWTEVLISKKDQGVVTFNTWGMIDGKPGIHHDKSRFIFDAKLNPKPAYYAIKKTILNSTLN